MKEKKKKTSNLLLIQIQVYICKPKACYRFIKEKKMSKV